MLAKKPKPNTYLDDVIENQLLTMAGQTEDQELFAKMVEQLSRLYKLKEQELPKRPSPDTVILVAANLIGIVLILGHERANVITSKAIGFVLRTR